MLKHLSDRTGLTSTELNIFAFFIFMFSVGIVYKHYSTGEPVQLKVFDYSGKDSLFKSADSKILLPSEEEIGKKKFDYKQEVLDFNTQDLNKVKPEKTSAEKSINLNTAGINELVSIPGLGEKTAEKILEYRSQNGSFQSISQLLNIKGIGEKKFEKIKKFIFIE